MGQRRTITPCESGQIRDIRVCMDVGVFLCDVVLSRAGQRGAGGADGGRTGREAAGICSAAGRGLCGCVQRQRPARARAPALALPLRHCGGACPSAACLLLLHPICCLGCTVVLLLSLLRGLHGRTSCSIASGCVDRLIVWCSKRKKFYCIFCILRRSSPRCWAEEYAKCSSLQQKSTSPACKIVVERLCTCCFS